MKNKKQVILKKPTIIIDESLDEIKNQPLPKWAQDKIDKARETLKKTGMPPEYYASKHGKSKKK